MQTWLTGRNKQLEKDMYEQTEGRWRDRMIGKNERAEIHRYAHVIDLVNINRLRKIDCNRLKKIYIYIYIYIYANFIKHNRHFMSTYFLLDPFEFPYYFYRILGELIYVLSIVACIPSTFCPTLGHHQGRIYYKSDVTFVLAYYYCVRASFAVEGYGVCFWMWFYI